jgi:Kef-type K+ transport system membrane component KefB
MTLRRRPTLMRTLALLGLIAASSAAVPGSVWAAGGGQSHFGPVLFAVALLVLAAKAGGLVAERWGQPPVLGELLVGIALGNVLLPIAGGTVETLRTDPTLLFLAQIGVLILLFDVGLEADLRALARVGPSSLIVALIGVVVPVGLGWAVAAWLMPDSPRLAQVFVGATLAATSVGITARVLKDLGVTRSREGQIVLGAAIVDDILGLMLLAIVGGMVGVEGGLSAGAVFGILARAVLFLGVTAVLGHFLSGRIVQLAARTGHPETMLVFGLAACFTLAYAAELVGLADIIGAFAAGLLLDPYGRGIRTREHDATLAELLHPLSSLFVPLFFVLMGLQVQVGALTSASTLLFAGVLTLCAVMGKLACALGVVAPGVNRLAVGIAMVPRGEVGLIFAGIGTTLILEGRPILSEGLFAGVVLMVLVTTLLAPIGLRWSFARTPVTRESSTSPTTA